MSLDEPYRRRRPKLSSGTALDESALLGRGGDASLTKLAAAAAIANRDHQVAIGETPSPPPTPTTPLKLAAPPKNGAKPKSPAHAARRASGIEREASLDDSSLRRPPMIRVDSLTSVRTDT